MVTNASRINSDNIFCSRNLEFVDFVHVYKDIVLCVELVFGQ